jgi:glutamyl-tRNA reductase
MHRTVVNVQTGEQTIVDLTAEEIAQAQAMKAAWDAEQAEIQASTKTLADQILESPTELAKLKAALGL